MLKTRILNRHNINCLSWRNTSLVYSYPFLHLLFVWLISTLSELYTAVKQKNNSFSSLKPHRDLSRGWSSSKIKIWKEIICYLIMKAIPSLLNSCVHHWSAKRHGVWPHLYAWHVENACVPMHCKAEQSTSRQFSQELASFVS